MIGRIRNSRLDVFGVLMIFVGGLWLVPVSRAQTDTPSKFRNNVIRVIAGDGNGENGFGVVVADESNFIYIVTAYHVVAGSNDPNSAQPAINVKFFWDQATPYPATLLKHEDQHDLALLRLPRPSQFTWDPKCLANSTEQMHGTKVWFVGRGSDWYVAAVDGAISSNGPDPNSWLDATMPGILPGSSGAPLFTENGITGLIRAQTVADTQVLSIGFVQQVVVQAWGYPWSLQLGPVHVQGIWNFKLANDIPLVFHFAQPGLGTVDSPKQNGYGFAMQYAVVGSQVTAQIQIPNGVNANFAGNIGPSNITGIWAQPASVPLQLSRAGGGAAIQGGSIQGDWQGALDLGLPIIIHLNSDGTGTFDVPRQNSYGEPLTYSVDGNQITIQFATPVPATFTGAASPKTMSGTYAQGQINSAITIAKQ